MVSLFIFPSTLFCESLGCGRFLRKSRAFCVLEPLLQGLRGNQVDFYSWGNPCFTFFRCAESVAFYSMVLGLAAVGC